MVTEIHGLYVQKSLNLVTLRHQGPVEHGGVAVRLGASGAFEAAARPVLRREYTRDKSLKVLFRGPA